MNKDNNFKYFAFISYSHKDKTFARKLQKKLVSYKLPHFIKKNNPLLPKRIKPVFRDETSLTTGILDQKIELALRESKFLIVICSPDSAKANDSNKHWVNKEVSTFMNLGRTENIIPIIIKGEPHSTNPKNECFCPALLNAKDELLGIDARRNRKLSIFHKIKRFFRIPNNNDTEEKAFIHLISKIHGLNIDELWNWEQKEQKKLLFRRISISFVLFLLFGFVINVSNQNKAEYLAQTAMNSYLSYDENTALLIAREASIKGKGKTELSKVIAPYLLMLNETNSCKPISEYFSYKIYDQMITDVLVFDDQERIAIKTTRGIKILDMQNSNLLYELPLEKDEAFYLDDDNFNYITKLEYKNNILKIYIIDLTSFHTRTKIVGNYSHSPFLSINSFFVGNSVEKDCMIIYQISDDSITPISYLNYSSLTEDNEKLKNIEQYSTNKEANYYKKSRDNQFETNINNNKFSLLNTNSGKYIDIFSKFQEFGPYDYFIEDFDFLNNTELLFFELYVKDKEKNGRLYCFYDYKNDYIYPISIPSETALKIQEDFLIFQSDNNVDVMKYSNKLNEYYKDLKKESLKYPQNYYFSTTFDSYLFKEKTNNNSLNLKFKNINDEELKELQNLHSDIFCYTSNLSFFAYKTNDETIQLWDIKNNKQLFEIKPEFPVSLLSLDEEKKEIAIFLNNGEIQIFDQTGNKVRELFIPNNKYTEMLYVRNIVCLCNKSTGTDIFDLDNGNMIQHFNSQISNVNNTTNIYLDYLILSNPDLVVFNLKTKKIVHSIKNVYSYAYDTKSSYFVYQPIGYEGNVNDYILCKFENGNFSKFKKIPTTTIISKDFVVNNHFLIIRTTDKGSSIVDLNTMNEVIAYKDTIIEAYIESDNYPILVAFAPYSNQNGVLKTLVYYNRLEAEEEILRRMSTKYGIRNLTKAERMLFDL